MPATRDIACGFDALLKEGGHLLDGKRVGLVAHAASVDRTGCSTAQRLRERIGDGLAALFSPEHGFSGIAGAGEKVASARHPVWNIPIHSLYGKTRRPTAAMLRGLDVVIFDLQDLSIRCYTYVSTLRYLLEAAHGTKLHIIVTDRLNPLAGIFDGPMLEPKYESFVGNFPGPLVYGLTAGQAARVLVKKLKLKVNLTTFAARGGYFTDHRWVSPSPAIRTPHSALCYPVTVGFEALPAIDYGRKTLMPFELIGSPELNTDDFCDQLAEHKLQGVQFHPIVYEREGVVYQGARIAVHRPGIFQPVASAVTVLSVLQNILGPEKLWKTTGSRPAFFDQLYGTDKVRRALQSGVPLEKIIGSWSSQLERWMLSAIGGSAYGGDVGC